MSTPLNKLPRSASREQELASRISQLRDQVTDKRITVQDHVTHLEILREEIDLVTNRKNDLEKKVHQLIAERENLSSALDDSADKMLMLEKHTREQDCQVRMTSCYVIIKLNTYYMLKVA